jgi:hypothetical protein
MRELADADRIRQFMRALGERATAPCQIFFTGGATAVLLGWRNTTIDVDIKLLPDRDEVLRAIPVLKDNLRLNVELAAPDDFIPVRSGWEERSPFVTQEGRITFRHFDLVAQALAKVERGHHQDVADVRVMMERGLVTADQLRHEFAAIESTLYRYPAVDPEAFRQAVADVTGL